MNWRELKEGSKEKLDEAYQHGRGMGADVWPDDILRELSRRDQAEQAKTILHLTRWIFWLTLVVAVATLLQLAIALKWIGKSVRGGDRDVQNSSCVSFQKNY